METKNVFEIIKEERIQDSAIRLQHRKEYYHNALQNIRNICGKRKNNEYTFADAFLFFQIQYGAKEISFEECLEYVFLPYYVAEYRKSPLLHSEQIIQEITDDSTSDMPDLILLLPPKQERERRYTAKNGFIVAMYERDSRFDDFWLAGNEKGYSNILAWEIDILRGKQVDQCSGYLWGIFS